MRKALWLVAIFALYNSCLSSTKICNQIWLTRNLDVTTYRDGTPIPEVSDPAVWKTLSTGAWCYYDNNSANLAGYGRLYNWYAVNDPRGLAPTGYHIATESEWQALSTCLGGNPVAGGKMKEAGTIHWVSPNTGATNSSGFTALPGGWRFGDGVFGQPEIPHGIGTIGIWWTATEKDANSAKDFRVVASGEDLYQSYEFKKAAFSVRCVKD